jgi:hypothetical protein
VGHRILPLAAYFPAGHGSAGVGKVPASRLSVHHALDARVQLVGARPAIANPLRKIVHWIFEDHFIGRLREQFEAGFGLPRWLGDIGQSVGRLADLQELVFHRLAAGHGTADAHQRSAQRGEPLLFNGAAVRLEPPAAADEGGVTDCGRLLCVERGGDHHRGHECVESSHLEAPRLGV